MSTRTTTKLTTPTPPTKQTWKNPKALNQHSVTLVPSLPSDQSTPPLFTKVSLSGLDDSTYDDIFFEMLEAMTHGAVSDVPAFNLLCDRISDKYHVDFIAAHKIGIKAVERFFEIDAES